jgi:hypothetical protein
MGQKLYDLSDRQENHSSTLKTARYCSAAATAAVTLRHGSAAAVHKAVCLNSSVRSALCLQYCCCAMLLRYAVALRC